MEEFVWVRNSGNCILDLDKENIIKKDKIPWNKRFERTKWI